MPLELHVWGPAFTLPSIDAPCLAAIAYLQQAVPRGEWELVASSDPALSPTNQLPALRNGDIWIGGFRNIFHYIAQYSAGEWVLDAGLPEQESADCIAFSSFVESHGQPLLDLSLYVSSQNYSEATRPIYNTIQPFPLPYLTPPSVRAAAKARTAHLGLSSLDVDTEDTTHSSKDSVIPQSLRTPRNTVSSLLASSPEANAHIRLDALAMSFFGPIQKLRRGKRFLVSDNQISSLDCLVLGYLCLMLVPQLPQPWLAKSMRKTFPDLAIWIKELRREIFGGDVHAEDALAVNENRTHLPWKAPADNGAVGIGAMFLSSMADSIPVLGQLRRNTRMQQHGGKISGEEQSSPWQVLKVFGGILTVTGLMAGFMFHQGMISFPDPEEPEKRSGGGLGAFGEAGDMLSMYATQMDQQVDQHRQMERDMSGSQTAPIVNVEVVSDGVRSNESVA